MSKGTKTQYTQEYKAEALKLWEAKGFCSKETAEELQIDPNYLPKWRRQLQRAGLSGAPGSSGERQPVAGDQTSEIARLKRENERLRMERDILKKAALIFGDGSRK